MNGRSRSLLDLAHRMHECTNCGRWCEAGCEPAHENGIEAGKGQSIKSHDHRHAAMCHNCHRFYDSVGRGRDPSDRYRIGHQQRIGPDAQFIGAESPFRHCDHCGEEWEDADTFRTRECIAANLAMRDEP